MNNNNNNEALPPKSCTIDRLVTNSDDVEKVINGEKTATRRNGRYADVGEVMNLRNYQFEIQKVYAQKLGEVTDEDAKKEGFADLEEYKQAILSIHPGMRWAPKMDVWVHEFAAVER